MERLFIGRKKELKELEARYRSGRKEFGVIYGRRRIGKSAIITHFLEGKTGLLFQAKRDNAYGNLRSFSYEVDKLCNLPKSFVFSSWEEAFDAVSERANGKRFVLAIDEYPYIVEQDSSFSSIVQSFIDHAGENIMLILSGSDVSFFKDEISDHASPLYKRRTFEMPIERLPFNEALEFVNDFPKEIRCSYLALMSTYPYYLAAIDHSLSFDENVQRLLFDQYGTFFTLPDQLRSNSTQIQDVYNAIMVAIAHRRTTIKSIADYIHEDDAKVSKYLSTLLASELVVKQHTFMGNKKTNYYVIGDPLLKFWYAFIFENQERIRLNGGYVFNENADTISDFIFREFENVSRLYLEHCNASGVLPDLFPSVQSYKVEKSALGRSVEIDGLAMTKKYLLVVECKYRNTPFDMSMLRHLKESASVFPDKLERVYCIFSKSGFTEEVKAMQDNNILLYTLDDIFAD